MEHFWIKPNEEITRRLGKTRTVFYSVDKDMNEVAIEGNVRMVEEVDDFWASESGAKDYRSEVMQSPTWLDIALAADDMINSVKDFHHTFLEGVYFVSEDDDGTLNYRFSMGS